MDKTIEERAESVATFKKVGEGMDEKDVILHNILMQGRREGYIKGASEQKAIDDAEKKLLIEKVIWIIETSYPDTCEWPHDDLVRYVTDDLERRADSLREMFG